VNVVPVFLLSSCKILLQISFFTIIIVVILIICRPSQTAPSSPTSPTQEVEVVNTGTICVKSAEKQSQ
jgi:hypothetical protein